MAKARTTSPLVRTTVKTIVSPTGKTSYRVRLTCSSTDTDLVATAPTYEAARQKIADKIRRRK